MKLVLLGTGTPEASPLRASSGYLIDFDGTVMQFDCGGGTYGRLLEAGYRPTDVDRLFISHLHSDHMMDYARLVHARWDSGAGRIPELRVYAPRPFAELSRKLFGADGVYAVDLAARCGHPASREFHVMRGGSLPRKWPKPAVREIGDGFRLSDAGVSVRAVEVPHAQPHLDCLAFRVDARGRSLVYSGDSGPSASLTALASGADLLIHMCFQLSGEELSREWTNGSSGHLEVAECARDAGVSVVVLTHLPPSLDEPDAQERARREMSEIYAGRIEFGTDLKVVEL